jgi:hypothetical protein
MHRKYGKDGLAAMSVSLDDPTDKEARARALAFLKRQKATCANYLLDAKPEEWQKKLKIDGPPAVAVYDRAGRLVKRWPVVDAKGETVEEVDYAAVEKLVKGLLKKK